MSPVGRPLLLHRSCTARWSGFFSDERTEAAPERAWVQGASQHWPVEPRYESQKPSKAVVDRDCSQKDSAMESRGAALLTENAAEKVRNDWLQESSRALAQGLPSPS